MTNANEDKLTRQVIEQGNDLLWQAMSVFAMQQAVQPVQMAFPNVIGVNVTPKPESYAIYAIDVNQLFARQEKLFRADPDAVSEPPCSPDNQSAADNEGAAELQAVREMYARNAF
ncbi:hypothetical protein QE250_12205 [Chromatiaceae bacterium AAb-1]|jgi:hypothetical protein|nr:hypothetical protein [Chromatiaceae bacterium AAb-1]